ncbi:MAG: copper homeostasis protein CutC [Lachnospiraceae bacterium]
MRKVELEVCCGSAADAIAAWQGGAKRVELNSNLAYGGLTPSLGTLRQVKKYAPDLSVICMVRPRESGFCYSDLEYETILEDAKLLLENGADGIAFGFLNEDRTIHIPRCKEMMEIIKEKQSVFHRAIDIVPNIFSSLDQLIELGVTRVLTSGQKPTALEGAKTIQEMIAYTKGKIEILPGSGIRPHNARKCIELFDVPYLHASMHQLVIDNTINIDSEIQFNSSKVLKENEYKMIFSEDIKNFISYF